jgi:hypothetical protein
MFKTKTTTAFPRHEFSDRLDALLAAASNSGMSDADIADSLEACANNLRHRVAVNFSHAPNISRDGGEGNAVERLVAALRGE